MSRRAIHVTVDEEVLGYLRQVADLEVRSVSQVIEFALRDYIHSYVQRSRAEEAHRRRELRASELPEHPSKEALARG